MDDYSKKLGEMFGGMRNNAYLCSGTYKERTNMNTIRINQVLYNDAVVYARKHNMSVDSLVENYIISLLGDSKSSYSYSDMTTSRDVKYKLSPRVKALEMEFVCPDNLSEDYKKEITEGRIKKGL